MGRQGFGRTLVNELCMFGVTANAVAPGFIVTDMMTATVGPIGVDFIDFR